MMVTGPDYNLTPYCSLNRGCLPFISPIFSDLGFPPEVYFELAIIFHNIRYIVRSLSWSCTSEDRKVLHVMLTAIRGRLIQLPNLTSPRMTNLDHELELCRAMISDYITHTLPPFLGAQGSPDRLENLHLPSMLDMRIQGKVNRDSEHSGSKHGHTAWDLFSCGMMPLDDEA